MRIFAIIPAAGKSTRMGRPKLSLPLGERTVLEHVVAALRRRTQEVLVVLAPKEAGLKDLAENAGARVLVLAKDTPDMRSTVLEGLHWVEQHFLPDPHDAFLLCPADHPLTDGRVIELLAQAARAHPTGIWIPTFQGRRGHPTLIAWSHVAGMRQLPEGTGLNRYLREHTAETLEVPCDNPDILLDLDTPEDYERLRSRFAAG